MDSNYMSEVEKLARTLRASKVAVSESEAHRMAEDMLATSKKVQDDHRAREREMYGSVKQNAESENAQRIMEKISANMAKGKSDVRIDLGEIDVERPLKELVVDEEQVQEHEEEDDAVLMQDASAGVEEPPKFSAVVTPHAGAQEAPEVINVHNEDDDFFDDDKDDDGTEEEKDDGSATLEAAVPETHSADSSEEESGDVSVKEVNLF